MGYLRRRKGLYFKLFLTMKNILPYKYLLSSIFSLFITYFTYNMFEILGWRLRRVSMIIDNVNRFLLSDKFNTNSKFKPVWRGELFFNCYHFKTYYFPHRCFATVLGCSPCWTLLLPWHCCSDFSLWRYKKSELNTYLFTLTYHFSTQIGVLLQWGAHCVGPVYYRSLSAAILVYDVTNRVS